MASKPLDILKKGLIKLKNSFKAKKEQLKGKLSRQESISSSDEHQMKRFFSPLWILSSKHVRTLISMADSEMM
jgi:hypothetical protein